MVLKAPGYIFSLSEDVNWGCLLNTNSLYTAINVEIVH